MRHLHVFQSEDRLYNKVWETTAFVVDRNTPGVEVTPLSFSGMGGAGIATVKFNNVRVTADDIVGSKNEAYEHAIDVLGDTHHMAGALCVGS
jgi:alkylation response protein AidB-like acyl-CoA dehydrogenase